MDESFHSAGVGTSETPAKLKQEVIYLKQRIEYQQSLLEDERKVTDDLLANKNRAIDSLQLRLKAAQDTHRSEMDSFQHKIDEKERLLANAAEERTSKVRANVDREKAQLKEQFEDTINKLRQQYTDEAAQIRKTQQEDMARLSTAHRRDIKKLQSQHEAVLAELKQSHAKEVLEAKEQARTASSAAERKFDAQWKHWKKDHDIRIQELQKKLDERETTIEQLKERAVNFNRLQDKRISDVRRGCEKEIASTREKAAHELEEAKSQLGEINRRLEQRFYKLESEYRQFKDAQGELLEGLRVKHRAELAAMHDDRHKATNDLRKEYEQKIKTLQTALGKEQELAALKAKQAVDAAGGEHEQSVRTLRQQHAKEIEKWQSQVASLEEAMQDIKFQLAVQNTYFKKKEEALLKDHDRNLVILKTLNSKTNESHQREIQNIQDLLEQKERTAQEHDDHILDLNNKIADLKLELQNAIMQSEKNVMVFEKKGQHFLEKLSEAQHEKHGLRLQVVALEKELKDRLDTIDSLRDRIDALEAEKIKLQGDVEDAVVQGNRSRKASPVRVPTTTVSPARSLVIRSPTKQARSGTDAVNGKTTVSWEAVHERRASPTRIPRNGRTIDGVDEILVEHRRHFVEDDGDGEDQDDTDFKFDQARRDLQSVIQSHIDRIESMTTELESQPTASA